MPEKLRPLLRYIEARLFDPQLNVNHLKLACKVRDNSAMVRFHSAVGTPPGAYITELRLETASRLLLSTDLPVWQVAEMVGYSTIQVFSQAFKRWCGQRPTSFRERGGGKAKEGPTPSQAGEIGEPKRMRNALNGQLSEVEARSLIHSLRTLYAEKISPPKQPSRPLRRQGVLEHERARCQQIWDGLRQESRKRQLRQVRLNNGLRTPVLFHLLRQKSRELGRGDRSLGIHLAELAVESLSGIEKHLTDNQLANLRAQGWVWIGTARRLALDLPGAEEAFLTAERFLPAEQPNRRVESELYALKAALRWYQRRLGEAMELCSRAIELARRISETNFLIEPLIMRAVLHEFCGDLESGIRDLREAISRIDEEEHPFLMLSATYNLTTLYYKAGRTQEASESLPKIVALHRSLGIRSFEPHLQWTHGLVRFAQDRLEEAESRLRRALDGFVQQNEAQHAAVVSIDLAICCFRQERLEECQRLVERVIPIFDALNVDQEAMAARALLLEAQRERTLDQLVLERARACLDRWRQDPAASALPLASEHQTSTSSGR